MRDLTKSVLTFPWALSMAGLQQVVNLVAPQAGGRLHGVAAALDAVTERTEPELDGWLDAALDAGDAWTRRLRDLSASRPPTFDASGLMRATIDPHLSQLLPVMSDYGVLPLAEVDALRLPAGHRSAALQECRNKLRAIQRLTEMRRDLKLDDADRTALTFLVDRAAAVAVDQRLAAVEAVGTHAGQRALAESGGDPQDVLTGESTRDLPPWSLTMLHAGVGVSFANAVLSRLTPDSPGDYVRHAVTRFAALCRRSARRGYAGAMIESFGMVARLLFQDMVPQLDREIRQTEPDMRGFFWHGVGRATYIDPLALLPSVSERRQLVVRVRQEAGDDEAYADALSGVAWAMAWTNIESPEVLELFLQHHAVPASGREAFANGVSSAIVVLHDVDPGDARIMRFVTHAPTSPDAAAAWASLVTGPCQEGLDRTYRELQQTCALGQLFHYRPRPA